MMSLLPQKFVGFEICGTERDGRRDSFHSKTPFGSQIYIHTKTCIHKEIYWAVIAQRTQLVKDAIDLPAKDTKN